MTLEDRLVTPTPEGVSLDVVLAGLGSRFVAYLLDVIVQGSVFLGAVLIVFNVTSPRDRSGWLVVGGALLFLFVFVFIGSFILSDMLWSGRSIGKKAAGIRVVQRNGQAVGFLASLLRNVGRLIDFLPSAYTVGIVAILVSPQNQRLGDMLAGTVVIRERHAADDLQRGSGFSAPAQWHSHAGRPLVGALATWDVSAITSDEVAVVRQFLSRRWDYSPAARERLADTLAGRLRPRVAGEQTEVASERFLESLDHVKASRGS